MKTLTTILLYSLLISLLLIWSPRDKNGVPFQAFHFWYLLLAAAIWIFSYRFFGGRFIRPKWKQAGKFIIYMVLSYILLICVRHYALVFIIGHQALGGLGHFMICRKHGIDFWTSQPEKKYLALTEKWAKGDFS